VAAVCHAPAVLQYVRGPLGLPLVRGLKVTGFSDTEEAAVGMTNVVPFLVEDMLKQNGGEYSKKDDWKPHAITDGNLVTGQNPASSANAAHAVLNLLGEREASQQKSAPLAMAS
jgi:putative intracellular protease/amidase